LSLGRFDLDSLKKVWKFTVSLGAISITTTILLSLDKLVVSKVLDLQSFGYYAIAVNIASALHHVNVPIYVSFLPRFTQYVEQDKEKELKDSYHLASQILSTLVFPAAALLFFFPVEILTIWRVKAETIAQVVPILRLLLVGTTLNTLLSNATALQLAAGQTRLLLIQNITAVILGVPLTIWVSMRFGAMGAAWIWIVMHFSFLLLTIPLMHRQLLQGQLYKWYRESCFYPLVGAVVSVYLGRLFFPEGIGNLGNFFYFAALFLLAALACVVLTPALRAQLWASTDGSRF
jgi:O-antigen/teichoic acid export membrane protein